jgi:hypothetical protein
VSHYSTEVFVNGPRRRVGTSCDVCIEPVLLREDGEVTREYTSAYIHHRLCKERELAKSAATAAARQAHATMASLYEEKLPSEAAQLGDAHP